MKINASEISALIKEQIFKPYGAGPTLVEEEEEEP